MTPSRCKYARAKYKKTTCWQGNLENTAHNLAAADWKDNHTFVHRCNESSSLPQTKTQHHTVTQCDQCCKGDTSSQWERAKLPLSTHPHPLTDSHQILHVITSTISAHMPHLVKIALGVISPHIAKVTTQIFKNFFLSLYAKSFNRPGG